MNINITITHALSPEIHALLASLMALAGAKAPTAPVVQPEADRAAAAEPAPQAPAQEVGSPEATEEAPKRGRGRPRKLAAVAAEPAAAQVDEVSTVEVPTPEVPVFTLANLKPMVQATVEAIGTEATLEVFAKFKAGRLSEVPENRYPEFVAALTKARGVVS